MSYTATGKQSAYAAQTGISLSDREIDSKALLSCASRLQSALTDGGTDMAEYAEAVKHNQRLWTIFQVALCDPENPLPQDLKMTLLSLSRYVDKTSFRAVTEFMPNLLESMIGINRNIAAGLMKKAQNVADATVQAETMPPPVAGSHTPIMTSV